MNLQEFLKEEEHFFDPEKGGKKTSKDYEKKKHKEPEQTEQYKKTDKTGAHKTPRKSKKGVKDTATGRTRTKTKEFRLDKTLPSWQQYQNDEINFKELKELQAKGE